MSDDLYLKAWRDAVYAYGGMSSNCDEELLAAAILRERFVLRVTGPYDGLIERLEAIATWQEHDAPFKTITEATAAIASLQAELAEANAALWQVAYKNWKDPEYAKAIARAALGDKQ